MGQETPEKCLCGSLPTLYLLTRGNADDPHAWLDPHDGLWMYRCNECDLCSNSLSSKQNAGYFWNRTMIEKTRETWDDAPEIKEKLESAGWRFAALIGIVDLDGAAEKEQLERDRQSFPHLARKPVLIGNEPPRFEEDDALAFVATLTSCDKRVCKQWMLDEWW